MDSLSNLKCLKLNGKIMDEFNSGLFDSLFNQLEEIQISSSNIGDKCVENLFYDRNCPKLWVSNTRITKLENKLMLDGWISNSSNFVHFFNKELRITDVDSST